MGFASPTTSNRAFVKGAGVVLTLSWNAHCAQDIKQWLSWLRSDVGFDGWRFDFVKGYPGRHTQEYIEGSSPRLAVGEFWDDCAYTDSKLEYNQVGLLSLVILGCCLVFSIFLSLKCPAALIVLSLKCLA